MYVQKMDPGQWTTPADLAHTPTHVLWSTSQLLQSNQVKRTPQDYIDEMIIWILNPLIVSRMQ